MLKEKERIIAICKRKGRIGLSDAVHICGDDERARLLLMELEIDGVLEHLPRAGGFQLSKKLRNLGGN